MTRIQETFLATAAAVADQVSDPRIATRWSQDSVLPGMTLGGLAAHAGRAVHLVEDYLSAPEPDAEPIDAAQYFALLPSLTDRDSTLNVQVLQRSEAAADLGHDALIERVTAALGRLRSSLPAERPDRRMRVIGDFVITLDEYLVTRLVELTVHSDDLVLSVGPESAVPAIPADAYRLVIDALVGTASIRHGHLGVLRALTRRERDDAHALWVI